MHYVKVFIEPEDVLNKLSEEDKQIFNRCVFTDVEKVPDGTVNITCLLLKNDDEFSSSNKRYRLQ